MPGVCGHYKSGRASSAHTTNGVVAVSSRTGFSGHPLIRCARRFTSAALLLVCSAWASADEHSALLDRIDAIRREHGIAAAAVVLVDGEGVLAQRSVGVTDWDSKADRKSTTSELQSLMRISYAVFCLNK